MRKKRKWLWGFVAVGVLAAVVLAFLLYIGALGGNIRTVVEGRAYRSALLPPRQLEELLRRQHVHTVISLMGGDSSTPWFAREDQVCRRNGATVHSVQLRATRLPPPAQLRALLELLDHSEYPILFHCHGGSDRSGLVATLYLHLYGGVPLDEAERRQLTWQYGHFRAFTPAMDQFFDLYRKDQARYGLKSWILDRYPSVYQELAEARRKASAG